MNLEYPAAALRAARREPAAFGYARSVRVGVRLLASLVVVSVAVLLLALHEVGVRVRILREGQGRDEELCWSKVNKEEQADRLNVWRWSGSYRRLCNAH